jgi:hypothetical protein
MNSESDSSLSLDLIETFAFTVTTIFSQNGWGLAFSLVIISIV